MKKLTYNNYLKAAKIVRGKGYTDTAEVDKIVRNAFALCEHNGYQQTVEHYLSLVQDAPEKRASVYGYVNGQPVYSRDEFVFKCRGFGAIESDEELVEYARKVTWNWSRAGHHHSFISFYLGDYALDHPYRDLTKTEYARLKELQAEAIAKHEAEEEARGWELVETIYWADNSVEEYYRDKNGETKSVMVVQPHGDVCF